ncbi:MAG TPA: alpha/beta hydrolase [Solirubrobacterales bacterium]|nr:alpha/beta hydrolase [Solirubrobacterales bacterium]
MIRQGSGEPLVLLHGITFTERAWRDVVPYLTEHHEVIVPTALGHNGGPPPGRTPVTMVDVIADAERTLDELGLERAHLAGNSMGGWTALELARRGRALSVCDFSPAGMWESGGEDMNRVYGILRDSIRDVRRSRRLLPLLTRSRRFRRYASRYTSADGAHVPAAELLAEADDLIACEVIPDPATPEALPPLDPLPCPVTIAWGSLDRLFPIDRYRLNTERLVPGARFVVLDGVGHVPMLDDPELVARTILAST